MAINRNKMIKDIKTMEPRYKGRQQNTFIGRNLARSTILNLYLNFFTIAFKR
jgi:hypothetical protein